MAVAAVDKIVAQDAKTFLLGFLLKAQSRSRLIFRTFLSCHVVNIQIFNKNDHHRTIVFNVEFCTFDKYQSVFFDFSDLSEIFRRFRPINSGAFIAMMAKLTSGYCEVVLKILVETTEFNLQDLMLWC
ncbi:hypothetical protein [Acidisoma silvae]|uniref:Uncharacterized protein n=1 Tax=Acidisoma silvae TaxID=2802396 RepID=A0A963YS46_9PROT|nr:hypothetical protein [Acidisoma silvae]MCB8875724.1 hypothetical protein [Acidisoma silvae]